MANSRSMTLDAEPITATQITDLRSALEFLKQYPEEYIETNEPVDPMAELSGSLSIRWGRRHCDAADTDWSGHGIQQGYRLR